jgi:hypothetical protein
MPNFRSSEQWASSRVRARVLCSKRLGVLRGSAASTYKVSLLNDIVESGGISFSLFHLSYPFSVAYLDEVHQASRIASLFFHFSASDPWHLQSCRKHACFRSINPSATLGLYPKTNFTSFQDKCTSPIWGWFGQSSPFDFKTSYTPAEGISRFLAGSPPLLQLAAVETGVDLINEVGMEALRAKSLQLSEYLIKLADQVRWLSHGCFEELRCVNQGTPE